MATLELTQTPVAQAVDAANIPALNHEEAGRLARTELDRFLALVESLSGDDWEQPTGCTAWNVREVLAHQAGSYAAYASWAQFRRQYVQNPYVREEDQPVDGINRRQVEDRQGRTPAQLVAELREAGPKAIRTRQRLPWILRKLPLPFGAPIGMARVEWLTDLIYPRDTWMHRVDICRATGREFVQSADHDGRMVALVVRDLAQNVKGVLDGKTAVYDLTGGPAGGRYRFGPNPEADAVLQMDVLQFNWLASGRMEASEARAHVTVGGDEEVALTLIEHTNVLY